MSDPLQTTAHRIETASQHETQTEAGGHPIPAPHFALQKFATPAEQPFEPVSEPDPVDKQASVDAIEAALAPDASPATPSPLAEEGRVRGAELASSPQRVSEPSSEAAAVVLTAVESQATPPDVSVQIHASGMNGALQRAPKTQVVGVPLCERASVMLNRWRPVWGSLKTIRLTFPEGFEFLPPPRPKEPKPEGAGEAGSGEGAALQDLLSLLPPPPPDADAAADPDAPPKATRLKPPKDAVSVEDRLFYLLQPPLESWLKGQELIMPFEPFSYQYEGIAWLFSQKAALLADEMGLGKTMQTITALRLLLRSGQVGRILLVCPKPLIPNWQREFQNWAEELPVVTIEGDSTRRKLQWTMPGVPILLANYEILVRDMEAMAEDMPKFDLLILDEAQRVKNRGSRTAVTTRSIPRKRSWALTGTPIENRPEEMASLFEFMEVIPPHCTPDLRQLSKLAKDYVLRRTKDLVMKDMPPRLDRDAILELNPAQRFAYDTAEKEGVIRLNAMEDAITVQHVFELVLRLKQITNFDPLTGESAKFDRLEADMEEVAASGGKAILFSQWTTCIDWLEKKLQRFNPLVYHGRIPTKHREPVLAKFKSDPKAHIILMSYATGAVGLNLQFAGYVFLFDRWWNPAVEDQAINRAHRIGQKSQVIVTRFISKDTIEERIDKVLTEKREMFRRVLGDGDNSNVSLSLNASEIFGLFDLKARHGKGTKAIGPTPPA